MEAWTSSLKMPSEEEEEAWGRRSSIGNVKTLRSKLQARRVTLNEAIQKENMFLQGSQRLASLSTDQHSRSEATLQKDFAHSKIKTLQAELTKINSSLHAYQAESAQGVQVPLIPLAMKTTTPVDFTPPLSAVISTHYHTEPEEMAESMEKFNEVRQRVLEVQRSEEGVRELLEYYNQLIVVSKRLLHSKLQYGVCFIWYDAISGLPATQQSTVFERACILFNVGALYSQLAAKVDRNSEENIDVAIEYLKQAIGVFEYMKEKFSHSPMVDMTGELLSLFSDLMRAQAHELFWEKAVLRRADDEQEGDLDLSELMDRSHMAKSVAECYRPVRELTDDDTIKKYLPDVWVALIKIKDAHYKAVAHYYAALTHRKLATIFENGNQVLEEVRTEIRFLYQDCPPEIMTNHPKLHVGILRSHINCAVLSHEYALKFCNLCRDLHHMSCLTKMLSLAQAMTVMVQEETADLEGVTMIAPTIIPSEASLAAHPPDLKKHETKDLFAGLGPLPAFSADRQWDAPRCILLLRKKGSFGFSVRGSQPVKVTSVEDKGPAEEAGVNAQDWVLAVNEVDVKYKSHDQVVAMVKACKDEVTLLVATPSDVSPAEPTSPKMKALCHSPEVETHELDLS